MNKTKIEWSDYTWNPVTGCWGPGGTAENPKRCWYCYAEKISKRFSPWEKTGCYPLPPLPYPSRPLNDTFQPLFWPERIVQLSKAKKHSRIFVCSMGDLFGDWVPRNWIDEILGRVKYRPQHTFIFLTKNPKRYAEFGSWPKNCWLGTTVTNQQDADERIPELFKAETAVRFVSAEPMLGPIDIRKSVHGSNPTVECPPNFSWMRHGGIHWLIIGALTGHGGRGNRSTCSYNRPQPNWVQSLVHQARAANVPVFLKDNLKWPEKIQEWPT